MAKAFSDLQILGMKHNGNYQELFGKVRRYGVSAEQELLRVTKGVNTQRGILFAGGLLAAAAGAAMNLSLIHISEPTRLGMISYAVFCLKKKKKKKKKDKANEGESR